MSKLREIWQNINRDDNSGFNIFSLCLILIYSLLVAFGAYHHEPWRDEAQAWLIARDLDFLGIISQMRYEGTPALWHIIIAPFAKLGFPYYTITIIHLVISISAISVFVSKSHLSKLFKILVIFSYYFAYEYAVIARNYSITILFLFLIASMYDRRIEKPILYSFLIFLLLNTNVFGFLIGVALSILYTYETFENTNRKKTSYFSLLILLLGFVIVFIQLYNPAETISSIIGYRNLYAVLKIFTDAFIPLRFENHNILTVLFFSFLALFFFYSFIKKPKLVFLILFVVLGFIYVFVFKHGGYHRHHALLFVFIVFLEWIGKYHKENNWILKFMRLKNSFIRKTDVLKKIVMRIISFCLLFSVIYNLNTYYNEYKYNFSGAKDMGDFIKNNNLDDYEIVTSSIYRAIAVIPHINQKSVFYLQTNRYGSFGVWDKHTFNRVLLPKDTILELIESRRLLLNTKILFLTSDSIEIEKLPDFEIIHKATNKDFWVDGEFTNENYWLYKHKD